MRHIIGSSEPDVMIDSDRDRSRGCKKHKDHIEFLCELCEAQAAQGRYFVHELTSEVSSRMECVVKIMAMPWTRAAIADLCMFGLAACDDGGPGFVNASVRMITNAGQIGVRLQSKYNGTHRHARVDAEDTIGRREQTGTWVRQAARAIEEQLERDKQELEMREQRNRGEDANRICSIIHENSENKGLSLVEAEMGKLMHQDEQELLSAWDGWHWDDNKGGWLDPELCAKARREEVEYTRRHKTYVRVPREVCLRETGKAPIKTGWAETDKGQPGRPNVRARWGCEGIEDTRQTRAVCVDTAFGGAESRLV